MFNENDFIWVEPKVKSRLAITVSDEKHIRINPALQADLPERIGIGYNIENMTLALRRDDAGHTYPKSGKIEVPEMIQALASRGMRFPARFTVVQTDHAWIGTLDPQSKPAINAKKPPRRKKEPNLESLATEAEKL